MIFFCVRMSGFTVVTFWKAGENQMKTSEGIGVGCGWEKEEAGVALPNAFLVVHLEQSGQILPLCNTGKGYYKTPKYSPKIDMLHNPRKRKQTGIEVSRKQATKT